MKIMMKNVMFSVAEKSSLVSGNGGVNFFYHLPACIVECVREYIFLISKNRQASKKRTRIQKKQKKLEKKREYLRKLIKRNRFAAARVNNFFVSRISGNKNIFFGLIFKYSVECCN